ncbi:GNAT family N-acetyltransferase [Facklamia miroungae]|uniref:Ribosomal protein S18 acetylase RimI n=1 Tax=Facklamia miroungae TaxID=120956 RepID=A0A1G7VD77_9LACT|nr:GNAT family N-acetyltransferase [Facklamia miroungae]NKZ29854.1 GNAT family N-acetyltransferase [Facklamia miroungae]SDG57756.1 Ribosomal protein S18 acetylase RimI [Facklamia miroungae]
MKIKYRSQQSLSSEERQAARRLIAHCHQEDQTYSDPYLFNRYNFDRSMPSFFTAFHGETMVGLLAVYADDPEVEITLMVDPEHRLNRIGHKLYQNFKVETAPFGIESVTFKSERVFLDEHPQLISHWGLEITEEEILMGRDRMPYVIGERLDINVKRAAMVHTESIARFQAESFENDYELSLRYAKETVANPESPIYLAIKDEKVVASVSVDQNTDVNYLFAIAVDPLFQGQGIASYLMKKTMNDLMVHSDKVFHLAVEVGNLPALGLYQKLGFSQLTRIVYLDFIA